MESRNETLCSKSSIWHATLTALRQETDELVPMDEHKQTIKLRPQRVKLLKVKLQGAFREIYTISIVASTQTACKQTKSTVIRNIFQVKDELECFLQRYSSMSFHRPVKLEKKVGKSVTL